MSAASSPASALQPYDFAEFQRRAERRRSQRRRRARWLQAGWLASVAAVGMLAWLGTRAGAGVSRATPDSALREAVAAPPLDAALAPSAVVRVDASLSAVALEDHIALVDHLLSDARVSGDPLLEMQRLERERARLVDSLVMIRRAESLMVWLTRGPNRLT